MPLSSEFGNWYLPHTRGGVSSSPAGCGSGSKSSPHPWGCFCFACVDEVADAIFPTPVGVFLRPFPRRWGKGHLPHTRGGVSRTRNRRKRHRQSSPHPWGCFPSEELEESDPDIFPTPVGVFLRPHVFLLRRRYLPHTRGGVSDYLYNIKKVCQSSPHPWGCFSHTLGGEGDRPIFPTPVGVFPFENFNFST